MVVVVGVLGKTASMSGLPPAFARSAGDRSWIYAIQLLRWLRWSRPATSFVRSVEHKSWIYMAKQLG